MAVVPQKSRGLVGKVVQTKWNERPELKQHGRERSGGRFKRNVAGIINKSSISGMRARKVGAGKMSMCLAEPFRENS